MQTDTILPERLRLAPLIRVIDGLTAAGNLISALCLLAIFGLVAAEIVMRNLMGISISFSWDVSAYLMGACFLLAAASAPRGLGRADRGGRRARASMLSTGSPIPLAKNKHWHCAGSDLLGAVLALHVL